MDLEKTTFAVRIKMTFFLAILPVCFMNTYAASVLEGPSNSTAKQGYTVVLKCKVDSLDESSGQAVAWEHDGKPNPTLSHGTKIVREGKMDRFSIVGNVTAGEYNLQINPVLAEDRGEYSCSVFRGDATGKSAILTVLYPPSDNYPLCYPLENTLHFKEIETLSIVCKTGISDPPATVTWIDDNGHEINDSSVILIGNEYVVTHKETMYNYHDGDTYFCSVSHPLWPEPRNCSLGPLFILYRPLTTISVQMTEKYIELNCSAFGNPSKFTYEWTIYRGNQTKTQQDFKEEDIPNKSNFLTLQRSKYNSVELVVECAARNPQGVGKSNATILLSSAHCRGGKTKLIDICRTVSVPTVCVLSIVVVVSWVLIGFLIMKVRKLKKAAVPEVSNVSSRVEMTRSGNNGVYVTLTESIDNLDRT
ncbi:cell adhesion molecule 3-like [Anneissia japonica]|uniref:cell adhesion molecule 3-like n=1 Tax=Anneissia japonica TaxID=1529436 RepID=UPI00142599E5|nr:cell adhesion molecule 3-like [Anneissia japonica]